MNNRGSVLDLFWIMIFIFVLGLGILFASKIKDSLFPMLEGMMGPGQATDAMAVADSAFGSLDAVFLFITIAMSAVMIVLAFQVQNHPVFFFVNILMLIILLVIAPTFSNMMRTMMLTDELSAYSSKYTMMSAVFQYFPIFMGGVGFILSIAQFAKGGNNEA